MQTSMYQVYTILHCFMAFLFYHVFLAVGLTINDGFRWIRDDFTYFSWATSNSSNVLAIPRGTLFNNDGLMIDQAALCTALVVLLRVKIHGSPDRRGGRAYRSNFFKLIPVPDAILRKSRMILTRWTWGTPAGIRVVAWWLDPSFTHWQPRRSIDEANKKGRN